MEKFTRKEEDCRIVERIEKYVEQHIKKSLGTNEGLNQNRGNDVSGRLYRRRCLFGKN